MLTIRHILVPLDFSQCSEEALPYAATLARKYGAKVTLLHVVSTNIYISAESELVYWDQLLASMEQEARKTLAATFSPAERAEFVVTEKVIIGIPFSVIIQEAKENQVDLIVMATHGRTGLSHVVIGSVAERVVRLSPVPVLTIHPRTEDC